MRRALAIAVAFAAAAFSAATPAAADEEKPYQTKFFVAASYVSPLSDSDQSFDGVVDSLEATEELGWEVGVAGRFNPLVGFELSYLNATQEVDFGGNPIGEVDFEPISLTLEFHLIPTSALDLWVGPTVSWVRWGDLRIEGGDVIKGGTDAAYGATVGLDLGLSEHLAITGAVRYLNADADLEGFESAAVDPLFARLGLAIRY